MSDSEFTKKVDKKAAADDKAEEPSKQE